VKKISIITVNYNNKTGLTNTIESVKRQTYTDFEFVVVDGGSTDGSQETVRNAGGLVNKFVSEKDRGIFHAQNKGISMASGEYLLFLNSGDFLCDNNVLEKVAPHLDGTTIVYGDMRINWGGGNITHGKMPDGITKQHMFLDTLWHPVTFIPKILFEKYGKYDESLRLVADYEFFFKVIIRHNCSAIHIPVEVCEFSTDGASSNKANKKDERAERRMVQERYLEAGELDKLSKLESSGWKKWIRRLRGIFK